MWETLAENLPHLTASLNAAATVCLAAGLWNIKNGRPRQHKRWMLTALSISGVFLAVYLLHKFTLYQATGEMNRRYPSDPSIAPTWSRYTYLAILGTHLVLAMLTPFLAIRAVYLAMKGRIVAHKRLVRFAYPVWMYVSVTGVLVYVFLYHHETFFPVG